MYEASRRRLQFFDYVEGLTRGQIQRVVGNPEHRNRLGAKTAVEEVVTDLREIVKAMRETLPPAHAKPANSAVQRPGARDARPGR